MSVSSHKDDPRKIWDTTWKIRFHKRWEFYVWVWIDALETRKYKWRCTLELDNTFNICGHEQWGENHATLQMYQSISAYERCNKSRELLKQEFFRSRGPDWFHLLISSFSVITTVRVFLLLWCAWHLGIMWFIGSRHDNCCLCDFPSKLFGDTIHAFTMSYWL
jgi:hypothetical protein